MSSAGYASALRKQVAVTVLNFTLTGVQTTLSALAIHRLYQTVHLQARTFAWSCSAIIILWLSFSVQMLGSFPVLLAVYRLNFGSKFWDGMFTSLQATMAILSVTADSLLTFRCWIIWERSRVFIFPAILIALKFALMVTTVFLYADGWTRTHLDASRIMADVSIALSLSFNILLAGAAIVRLLRLRADLRRVTGASGSHYIRVVQLIALNAALWAVGCIMSLIFKIASPGAPFVGSINSFLLATCPLLLFLDLGRQRPQVCEDIVYLQSLSSSIFMERYQAKRSTTDIISLHEALRIPGTLRSSHHERPCTPGPSSCKSDLELTTPTHIS